MGGSCVSAVKPPPPRPQGVHHQVIPLLDIPEESVLPHLASAAETIAGHVEGGRGRVLVHCMQGVSRSASLVVAYVMTSKGLSLADALATVQAARPVVLPNPGFLRQLEQFEGQRPAAVSHTPRTEL